MSWDRRLRRFGKHAFRRDYATYDGLRALDQIAAKIGPEFLRRIYDIVEVGQDGLLHFCSDKPIDSDHAMFDSFAIGFFLADRLANRGVDLPDVPGRAANPSPKPGLECQPCREGQATQDVPSRRSTRALVATV
jgi:hypothetical protein